jgi:hypothetical protein
MVGSIYISGWEYKSYHCLCIYMEKCCAYMYLACAFENSVDAKSHQKHSGRVGRRTTRSTMKLLTSGLTGFVGVLTKKTLNDGTTRTLSG